MVLPSSEDDDGRDDCADEEGKVDLYVGEENEPLIARSLF